MDPNTEGGPEKATIAEVDIEVEHKAPASPPSLGPPPPSKPLEPEAISAGDIFRSAFRPPSAPPPASRERAAADAGKAAPTRVEGGGNAASTLREGTDSGNQGQLGPAEDVSADEASSQHEADFQRKLRGEYEAVQQRLGEVVSGNMDRPLRLTSIRFSPAPPTSRPNFLSSLVTPFLQPPPSWLPSWLNPAPPVPTNLHEILLTTRALVAHIDKFGVYDTQRTGVGLQPVRGGDPDEVELVLGLRERGRLFLKAGTEVGGGEGGGNVTARIRNALGGAESLEVNASIGTKTKSAYQVSLSSPLLASPLLSFALQAFSFDRDNTAFASHREAATGARAKLSAIAPWGTHDLAYEYIKREIAHLAPNASVSVRELAHPTTKSAITHTWTSDTRDDPWTGTSGRLLKLTNEYAGLPGSSASAQYFKSVVQTQLSRALYPGSNIRYSISSLTSTLLPLCPSTSSGGHPATTPLPDRFFLGGPNSVRGYKIGGMGARDGPDSLGGDLAWGLGLSVFAPIPKKEHWPLHLHGFVNAGKVVAYKRDAGWMENAQRMYRNPNLSVGVGLMYRLDPIRIELNFAMPLVGRRWERTSRGLGIGVGIEFL